MSAPWTERVLLFGSHGGLVGVLAEPTGGLVPGRPVAVMANVGLNHRVGPNRAWVELGRRLASAGFGALRFDLSGFGDSEPRRDTLDDSARALLDLREALDTLAAKRGATRFLLVANCSGTDSQHALALGDPRVCGLVTVDGYAYANAGYWLRHYGLRFLQPARWRRLWVNRRLARAAVGREPGEVQEVWTRDIPTRERYAADLDTLCARGVRLLLVFTSGVDMVYNHRGQFHATFGQREPVEVLYDARADHLFSTRADRERFLEHTLAWTRRHFEAPA
jgi:pimeloyl-ACP methyl ester carboxylesterase